MKRAVGMDWPGGYKYQPFTIHIIDFEFAFSRRSLLASDAPLKGSNVSAVWNTRLQETLLNGVLQGRKQSDPRGASSVSCMAMSRLTSETVAQLIDQQNGSLLVKVKDTSKALLDRDNVKEEVRSKALQGWIRNEKNGSSYLLS